MKLVLSNFFYSRTCGPLFCNCNRSWTCIGVLITTHFFLFPWNLRIFINLIRPFNPITRHAWIWWNRHCGIYRPRLHKVWRFVFFHNSVSCPGYFSFFYSIFYSNSYSYTERFPKPGESVRGKDFKLGAGGKGANQCVQIAKLGGNAVMIGRVSYIDFLFNFLLKIFIILRNFI